MTDKVERKLRDVVLARYTYRQEAEFAAGFLRDAGIPFRLQVDDPALGMTIGTPATIWVRGMDVRAALEVLDLPEQPGHAAAHRAARSALEGVDEDGEEAEAEAAPTAEDGAPTEHGRGRARLGEARVRGAPGDGARAGDARMGPGPPRRSGRTDSSRLTGFERLLGVGLLVAAGSTTTVPAVGAAWAATLIALALPFGVAGLVGRAPGPIRGLLRAISGSAP